MPYISGSPIEANCTNCKIDTEHVVLEMAGLQVRSVRCKKCQQEDTYRAPRDKAKAALMEYSKKKNTTQKTRTRTRKTAPPAPEVVFAQLMDGLDTESAVPYNIKNQLEEGELIDHPKFGIGIVTARTDNNKAKVVFESGERVMICNRT